MMLLVGLVGVIILVVAVGSMLGESGKRRSRSGGMDSSGTYIDAGSSDHDSDGDHDSGGDDGGDGGGDGGGGDGGGGDGGGD